MYKTVSTLGLTACVIVTAVSTAAAQSSSLFQEGEKTATERSENARSAATQPVAGGAVPADTGASQTGAPAPQDEVTAVSFMAVTAPPPRSFLVNDLVTIVVVERTQYRADNRLQQDRRWDLQWKLEQWFRIRDSTWLQQPFNGGVPEVDMALNDRRTGNARADRKDELTTRITASVIDVKPNGLLVVEATKRITYAEETQVSTLMGICRSADVTADNTVLSTQLADLEVITTNEGAVHDTAKRGWLQKVIDLIKPF